jgi:hypothetical protein
MRRPRNGMMNYVGSQLLVSPLSDPALTLRRRMLVNDLFKHVEEIRNLDSGYAFRFRRSHDREELIGTIADYIIFESRNAPQLTFEIVEEPQAKAFWLQVQSLEDDLSDMEPTSMSFYSFRLHFV